jgi:hypothetical protein
MERQGAIFVQLNLIQYFRVPLDCDVLLRDLTRAQFMFLRLEELSHFL